MKSEALIELERLLEKPKPTTEDLREALRLLVAEIRRLDPTLS